MARTVDLRLSLDDELFAFLEGEVKRLRTNGRAGYVTQLMAAALLARQGDMSLAGLFAPQLMAVSPPAPPPSTPTDTPRPGVDDALKDMF